MLKTAVFDCAIGEKCCSVDGRQYLPSFFRPHPGRFDSSRVPTPWNLPSKAKVVGGGGWVQLEYFSVNFGHGLGGSL